MLWVHASKAMSAAGKPLGGQASRHVLNGRDELVPFNQSCRIYERLRQAGDEVEFHKLLDANHGKALFTDPCVLGIVIDFLDRHLRRD